MKLTILSQDNAVKERPFSRVAQIVTKLIFMGHDVKYVYGLNKFNFFHKLNEIKNDHILVSIGFKPGIFTSITKKILKNNIVIHDWIDLYAEIQTTKGLKERILFPFLQKIEEWIIKSSDYIITNSIYNRIKAEIMGKSPIYIPNGIDKKIFDLKKKNFIKKKYDKPIVLYIGGLAKFKNIEPLIRSVKNLDCYLMLVGNGEREKLKNIASKNIIFIGRVPRERVPYYIKIADICCSPVDWDANLKVYEYMYMGKAVLSIKGRPELLLKDGYNALIVDPTERGLSDGIRLLLENTDLKKRMEKNAKKFKVYDWNDVVKMYIKNLEKIYDESNIRIQ